MLLKDINPFVRYARQFAIMSGMPSALKNVRTRDNRIFFAVGGSGSICIEGVSYPLARHTLVILRAGDEYRIEPDGRLTLIVVNFDFTNQFSAIRHSFSPFSSEFPGALEDISIDDAEVLSASVVIDDAAEYEDRLKSILRDFSKYGELGDAYASAVIKTVLVDAALKSYEAKEEKTALAALASSVADYVRENYGEPVENETLSKHFHFTSVYINRVFKRYMGTSVHKYLISVRIDIAKELIQSREYSPSEVAVMVGFDDYPHFSKTFKRLTGKSPSDYCK